ncbi:MAG: type VI secretion system baseplate subunit TssK [Desulfosalsimonas sp.]|uniref:type VI secretion system baseplate subunit TssK n=1 Tax=Desulfosalsimonas sp. TaxID=3073848 RepID=UPI003970C5E1
MKSKSPLYWHQGLFLQPHHFQQFDQYQQSLLLPLKEQLTPYFWGVIENRINKDALKNQTLEINRTDLIFPDGTWVEFPGNSLLQSRSFDHAWVEADKPFTVYLGLRKLDPNTANAAVLNNTDEVGSAAARLVTFREAGEVGDLYTAGPRASVPTLQFLLRIFWENEITDLNDYMLIPIAQLWREGEDILVSGQFVPPCLSVTGSDSLFKMIKSVRDQIASRCRQLQEYKSPKEIQTSSFDTEYMVYLLALRSLNRYAPSLFHLLEAPNVHPWQVYALFRQIVGELSSFSDRINALGETANDVKLMPAYDHSDLTRCFSDATTLITELLNDIIIGPEHIIRLERDDIGFRGEIPPEALDRRNEFYLVIRSKTQESALKKALANIVKICSVDHMPTLISRALPGIALEQTKIPPPGLPRRPDSQYFRIDRSDGLWRYIERSQNIQIYWENPPEDLFAEIVVLQKQS